MRNAHKILVCNGERKRPFERPMGRWEDNIKNDFKEMGLRMWSGFIWPRLEFGGGIL
jgi:hypothetical protein